MLSLIEPWKRKVRLAFAMARSEGIWNTARYAGRRFLYETFVGRMSYAGFFHLLLKPRFMIWRFRNRGKSVQVACLRPFSDLNVGGEGRCYLCCPGWLPVPVGNLENESIEQVFNSTVTQGIRIGMYTGRTGHCRASRCVLLSAPSYRPVTTDQIQMAEMIPEDYKRRILSRELRFPEGPSCLKESVPSQCNIRCEFCHHVKFSGFNAIERNKALLAKLFDYIVTHSAHLRLLAFSGGEPMVDPWVQTVLSRLMDNKISYQFTSNLNQIDDTMKEILRGIRINRIHVSVNAATKDTYQRLCKGGDWDSVLRNLDFILRLRDSTANSFYVGISMVVTKWNYAEVAAFAELGVSLKVDRVRYHPLYDNPRNGFLKLGEPERRELERLLKSDVFANKKVRIDVDTLRACCLQKDLSVPVKRV